MSSIMQPMTLFNGTGAGLAGGMGLITGCCQKNWQKPECLLSWFILVDFVEALKIKAFEVSGGGWHTAGV